MIIKTGSIRRLALLGSGFLLLFAVVSFAGAKVNTTKSIPVGLYWAISAQVRRGAYVMFCPPENNVFDMAKSRGYIAAGFCPGDYGCLMKRVVALGGDSVNVSPEGVFVNGALLPNSKPLTADLSGRPLPQLRLNHYLMQASQVFLMSDVSKTSFDGRYYGPVDISQIKTVIRPVITW